MRRLLVTLVSFFLLTGGLAGLPLKIGLEGPPPSQTARGEIVFRAKGQEEVRLPVQAPGEAEVNLKRGVAWQGELEIEGLWAAPVEVPDAGTTALEVRAFREGRLLARLQPPPGTPAPGEIDVRIQTAAPRDPKARPFEAVVRCPAKDGKLACAVPAGRWDLRLRSAEFVPVYLWAAEVPPSTALELGTVPFREGASVSGWVEADSGAPPPGKSRVILEPFTTGSPQDSRTDERLKGLRMETGVTERGFFQFVGVAPGTYRVSVEHPDFAPASLSPIEVRPGLESQVIDRLVLAPPVAFEVVLDPPTEPYGRPWRLSLERRKHDHGPSGETFQGTASEEGAWKISGLTPGTYRLMVQGEHNAVWHSEFVEIEPGGGPLFLQLPLVEVRGSLRLGDEPLEATLWFIGERQRLRFDSDEEGRFEGLLPKGGLWGVELSAPAERLRLGLEPVEVQVPRGKRVAEVEIVVPDTRVAGEVVDEEGRPVADARVRLSYLFAGKEGRKGRGATEVSTSEDGSFSIRGIKPGSSVVSATLRDRESDHAQVAITEEGEAPSLRLVLRGKQDMAGRVVSPEGGVPGALLFAMPSLAGQAGGSVAQTVTGSSGEFEIRLPSGTRLVQFLVFPPGHGFRMLSLPVQPGRPVDIPVERAGGTLVLETGSGASPPLLVHEGAFIPVTLLERVARMHGGSAAQGRIELPNAAAGNYSLCQGAQATRQAREGAAPPATLCDTGLLLPGGELSLTAPAAPAGS